MFIRYFRYEKKNSYNKICYESLIQSFVSLHCKIGYKIQKNILNETFNLKTFKQLLFIC